MEECQAVVTRIPLPSPLLWRCSSQRCCCCRCCSVTCVGTPRWSGEKQFQQLFGVKSLRFNPCLIMLKLGRYFFHGFCDQQVHLSISCAIINIDDVILGTSDTVLHEPIEFE